LNRTSRLSIKNSLSAGRRKQTGKTDRQNPVVGWGWAAGRRRASRVPGLAGRFSRLEGGLKMAPRARRRRAPGGQLRTMRYTLPSYLRYTLPPYLRYTLPPYLRYALPPYLGYTLPPYLGYTLPPYLEANFVRRGIQIESLSGVVFKLPASSGVVFKLDTIWPTNIGFTITFRNQLCSNFRCQFVRVVFKLNTHRDETARAMQVLAAQLLYEMCFYLNDFFQ